MTPAGSMSQLSVDEANRIIDRLKFGRPFGRRSAQGTATGKQLGLIQHISRQIGFSANDLTSWLRGKFKIASLDDVRNRDLASRIIGGLMGMQRNLAERRTARATR